MIKNRIVRAVDSGNIQRSPTFQAIFNYYYSSSDQLPSGVVFDSAGIDVEKILANSTPAAKKLDIIDAARYYDLIRDDDRLTAKTLLDRWLSKSEAQIPAHEKERITVLYSRIKNNVHTLQMRFRNEALLEAGIPQRFLPGMRVQFTQVENLALVMPVEESVSGKLEDYYRLVPAGKPIIKIYGDLAGSSPLKDELTGGLATARKQVKYFMDTREKAIKEIVSLLSGDASW
jgi:protein-tyrosine-phosphatase